MIPETWGYATFGYVFGFIVGAFMTWRAMRRKWSLYARS